MAVPCVPTLGSQTFLTDVNQILVYVFRQYIMMPKSRTDIYQDLVISYMDDVSRIGQNDLTIFAKTIEDSLKSVYDRIFKDSTIDVRVTTNVTMVEESKYELAIVIDAIDTLTKKIYSVAPIVVDNRGEITIENDTVVIL